MASHLVDRHVLKEKRRANKPMLERKRRARINDSLSELKHLVLTSLDKDLSKYTKMEKVDILDMTVRFLRGNYQEPHHGDFSNVYMKGYMDSKEEICHRVMSMNDFDHNTKCKILASISNGRSSAMTSPPPSPTLSESSLPSPQNYMSTGILTQMTPNHKINNTSGGMFLSQTTSPPPQLTSPQKFTEIHRHLVRTKNEKDTLKPKVWRPW